MLLLKIIKMKMIKPSFVIVSSNLNELYLDFWEIVYKSWKHIGIEPILILILEPDQDFPEGLKYQENIIEFYIQPKYNAVGRWINSAFVAQCIRLLYPAILFDHPKVQKIIDNYNENELLNKITNPKETCFVLISDMDIIPMNKTYFEFSECKLIFEKNDNLVNYFIEYRANILHENKEVAMCYNAAVPQTWNHIFHIDCLSDIYKTLEKWYLSIEYDGIHGGKGWSFDQKILYHELYENYKNHKKSNYSLSTVLIIQLYDENQEFNRLDREFLMQLLYHLQNCNNLKGVLEVQNQFKNIETNIVNGVYSDYHMLRPYKKFKHLNDKYLNLLLQQ